MSTRTITRTAKAIPLGTRSILAVSLASVVGLIAFLWPFLAAPESAVVAHATDAPFFFALLVPLVLVVVLAQFADGAMDAKSIALLGVLSAVIAALRPLGAGVAGIEPIWAVLILGGFALGPGFGFVLGSVSLFASALITGGVGPWLPFQMIAAAWIGMGAGLIARIPVVQRFTSNHHWREVLIVAGYALLAAVAYGFALNLWFWPFTIDLAPAIAFQPGAPAVGERCRVASLQRRHLTRVRHSRALLAAGLILIAGRGVLLALRRASRRAAFDHVVDFAPHDGVANTSDPRTPSGT